MSETNELKLKGKMMNIIEINDALIRISISVVHEHYINGTKDIVESFVDVLVNDTKMISNLKFLRKGEKVRINGHLKLDYSLTSGGNRKEMLRVYADKVELDS